MSVADGRDGDICWLQWWNAAAAAEGGGIAAPWWCGDSGILQRRRSSSPLLLVVVVVSWSSTTHISPPSSSSLQSLWSPDHAPPTLTPPTWRCSDNGFWCCCCCRLCSRLRTCTPINHAPTVFTCVPASRLGGEVTMPGRSWFKGFRRFCNLSRPSYYRSSSFGTAWTVHIFYKRIGFNLLNSSCLRCQPVHMPCTCF